MSKKKVLIVAPYSHPSACGIWTRVYSDARALRDAGYEVYIFSSNIVKGTNERSSSFEEFDGLKLYRSKVLFKLGGTSMFWFFPLKFIKLKPDIVHVHGYRHPHSIQAFILSKLFRKKIYMTTHGPFEKDPTRSVFLKFMDRFYDLIIGSWELRFYTKVIRIANWEEAYLKKLGVKSSLLIPNSLKSVFLATPLSSHDKVKQRVVNMGRIDKVKRLEWIQYAATEFPNIKFLVEGPIQDFEYLKDELSDDNFDIINRKFTSEEFIDQVDKSDIFVLPSVRESFGIVILEAMSRGKIVISSNTKGGEELIENGVNGFIIENENELVEAIEYSYTNWEKLKEIRENAIEKAKLYDEKVVNQQLIELYNSASQHMLE